MPLHALESPSPASRPSAAKELADLDAKCVRDFHQGPYRRVAVPAF
jgi:hypothetical protein